MNSHLVLCGLMALFVVSGADVAVEDQFKIEDESVARILISKLIQNKYLVEGLDINVRYSLYNVGSAAALNVQVRDLGFGQGDFSVVAGQPEFELERLAPGANVSHTLVVRPLKFGYYNFTAAEVSYLPSETATDRVFGLSSEPGEGGIVALRDYNKKFSSHVLDWLVFAVMTLPSLGIPFALWFSSKSKYDQVLAESALKKRE